MIILEKLTIKQIIEATNATCIDSDLKLNFEQISIDTRTIQQGDLFIAIVGENMDGHDFVKQAFANGCTAAIVNRPIDGIEDRFLIIVEDTLKALQSLAKYYLSLFDIKVVAITGSTGKTSTKEYLVKVLEECFQVAKTKGNYNNQIGLPLSVFNIKKHHEIAVFEMGMSDLMEIDLLASIVEPEIAVITNIGLSHIENLGSRENILKAKMEITHYFKENDKLILNADNDLLSKVKNEYSDIKVETIGKEKENDYVIGNVETNSLEGIEYEMIHEKENYQVKLSQIGEHNAYNATLAIAVAKALGMPIEKAINGASKNNGEKMRLTIEKGPENIVVLNDVYNASPDSMNAAIDALVSIKNGRKVAILADMLEMGNLAKKYHQEVGAYAVANGVDVVIAYGSDAKYIVQGMGQSNDEIILKYYDDKNVLLAEINNIIKANDVILVKGSRGMKMEEIVNHILRGAPKE